MKAGHRKEHSVSRGRGNIIEAHEHAGDFKVV